MSPAASADRATRPDEAIGGGARQQARTRGSPTSRLD